MSRVLALTSSTTHASVALSDGIRVFERSHQIPRGHTEFMNVALDALVQESGWSLSSIDVIAVDHGPGSFTGIRVAVSMARSLCYALGKPSFIANSLEVLAQNVDKPVACAINAYKNLIFFQTFTKESSPLTSSEGASLAPKIRSSTPDDEANPIQPGDVAEVHGSRPASAEIADNVSTHVLSPAQVEAHLHSLDPARKLTLLGDAWSVYERDWSPEFKAQRGFPVADLNYPQAEHLAKLALVAGPQGWTQDWKSIAPLYLRASAAEENLRKV